VVFVTVKVPVKDPAPGLEGTVKLTGLAGKLVEPTLEKPAMEAAAPHAMLYLLGLLVVAV
jgi:hypothetical protein